MPMRSAGRTARAELSIAVFRLPTQRLIVGVALARKPCRLGSGSTVAAMRTRHAPAPSRAPAAACLRLSGVWQVSTELME